MLLFFVLKNFNTVKKKTKTEEKEFKQEENVLRNNVIDRIIDVIKKYYKKKSENIILFTYIYILLNIIIS